MLKTKDQSITLEEKSEDVNQKTHISYVRT